MLNEIKSIILRREYLGFVLGVLSLLAAQTGIPTWSTLVVLCLIYLGFPIIRKYGN